MKGGGKNTPRISSAVCDVSLDGGSSIPAVKLMHLMKSLACGYGYLDQRLHPATRGEEQLDMETTA